MRVAVPIHVHFICVHFVYTCIPAWGLYVPAGRLSRCSRTQKQGWGRQQRCPHSCHSLGTLGDSSQAATTSAARRASLSCTGDFQPFWDHPAASPQNMRSEGTQRVPAPRGRAAQHRGQRWPWPCLGAGKGGRKSTCGSTRSMSIPSLWGLAVPNTTMLTEHTRFGHTQGSAGKMLPNSEALG